MVSVRGFRKFGKIQIITHSEDPQPVGFGDNRFKAMVSTSTLGHIPVEYIEGIGVSLLRKLNEVGLKCPKCGDTLPYSTNGMKPEQLDNDTSWADGHGCEATLVHNDLRLFQQVKEWFEDHKGVKASTWTSFLFQKFGRLWEAITPYRFEDIVEHVEHRGLHPLKTMAPKYELRGYFVELTSHEPQKKKDWLNTRVAEEEARFRRSLTASEKMVLTDQWKATFSKRYTMLFYRPRYIRGEESMEEFHVKAVDTELVDFAYMMSEHSSSIAEHKAQTEYSRATAKLRVATDKAIRDISLGWADEADRRRRAMGLVKRGAEVVPTVSEALSTVPRFAGTEIPPPEAEEKRKRGRGLPGWLNPINFPLFFSGITFLGGLLSGGDPISNIMLATSIGFFALWGVIKFVLAPRVEFKKEKAKQEERVVTMP